MKLVIAEKPMLARDIARAICGIDVGENDRLPIKGNGYMVVACAGHLLELKDPMKINSKWGKPWREENLPIYIENWQKEPTPDKIKLIHSIQALLQQADSVIHAGDPDDEGQLIVDELLDYCGYSGKVERVFVNDNIEKNIVKAFESLEDNDKYRPLSNAAYARQVADYAFGINETRLASLRLGSLFSVGRVQTPTLGLIVRRDEQIKNHTMQKFYELFANTKTNAASEQVTFKFKPSKEFLNGENHIYDKSVLEQLASTLENTQHTFVTKVTEKTEQPPLPYNLTALLADMNKKYKLSAAQTQKITQDLRDKYKAITYNRTDCQYLKEEHFTDAEQVLSVAMQNIGANWPLDYSIKSKAFNDKNVTAHHGIIPQEIKLDINTMTKDERNVYTAICTRYAMQFMQPAIYEISTSTFEIENGIFEYSVKRAKQQGYKANFAADKDEEENKEKQKTWIDSGQYSAHVAGCEITEQQTQPPKPYTEGSLIKDMASIAKYVIDAQIKKILQEKDKDKKGEHGGIGTTATRSEIIEKLKMRKFIEEIKGKIRATDTGIAFYNALPENIKTADTTAKWWLLQQDIQDGKKDINAIQQSVIEVFEQHKADAYKGTNINKTNKPIVGNCPVCGNAVIQTGSIYQCSSNKYKREENGQWQQTSGCGFKLFGWGGKKLTINQATKLLQGKLIRLKGCTSKKGSKYDCKIHLKKDGKIEPIFDSLYK